MDLYSMNLELKCMNESKFCNFQCEKFYQLVLIKNMNGTKMFRVRRICEKWVI